MILTLLRPTEFSIKLDYDTVRSESSPVYIEGFFDLILYFQLNSFSDVRTGLPELNQY